MSKSKENNILDNALRLLEKEIERRLTEKIIIEVDLKKGGIGNANVYIKKKIEWQLIEFDIYYNRMKCLYGGDQLENLELVTAII